MSKFIDPEEQKRNKERLREENNRKAHRTYGLDRSINKPRKPKKINLELIREEDDDSNKE